MLFFISCGQEQLFKFSEENQKVMEDLKSSLLEKTNEGLISVISADKSSAWVLYSKEDALNVFIKRDDFIASHYHHIIELLEKDYKVVSADYKIENENSIITSHKIISNKMDEVDQIIWYIMFSHNDDEDKNQDKLVLSYL